MKAGTKCLVELIPQTEPIDGRRLERNPENVVLSTVKSGEVTIRFNFCTRDFFNTEGSSEPKLISGTLKDILHPNSELELLALVPGGNRNAFGNVLDALVVGYNHTTPFNFEFGSSLTKKSFQLIDFLAEDALTKNIKTLMEKDEALFSAAIPLMVSPTAEERGAIDEALEALAISDKIMKLPVPAPIIQGSSSTLAAAVEMYAGVSKASLANTITMYGQSKFKSVTMAESLVGFTIKNMSEATMAFDDADGARPFPERGNFFMVAPNELFTEAKRRIFTHAAKVAECTEHVLEKIMFFLQCSHVHEKCTVDIESGTVTNVHTGVTVPLDKKMHVDVRIRFTIRYVSSNRTSTSMEAHSKDIWFRDIWPRRFVDIRGNLMGGKKATPLKVSIATKLQQERKHYLEQHTQMIKRGRDGEEEEEGIVEDSGPSPPSSSSSSSSSFSSSSSSSSSFHGSPFFPMRDDDDVHQ